MPVPYTIPRPSEPVLDQNGHFTVPWQNYLRTRYGDAAAAEIIAELEAQIADLLSRVEALEEGESARIVGPQSVSVVGSLANGLVQLTLVNDESDPLPVSFYATNEAQEKGWQLLQPNWVPNPYAGYLVDENGDYLIDENGNFLTSDDGFPINPDYLPDHNEINGLQGGVSDEFYHLTEAQYDNVAVIREALTGTRNYYVSTTGSDSNDGLTALTPFLTIQKAADTVLGIDTKGFQVIINLADGTYTAGMSITNRTVGGSSIQLIGNVSSPANVVIDAASGNCINANFGALCQVSGVTFRASAGSAIVAGSGATVFVLGSVVFDDVSGDHALADSAGRVQFLSNYTVTGDCINHWHATNTGNVSASGITITVTGTPTMNRWAGAAGAAVINAPSNTYVGTMTGDKFLVHRVALINTEGASVSAFPGSNPGTQISATGGYYV